MNENTQTDPPQPQNQTAALNSGDQPRAPADSAPAPVGSTPSQDQAPPPIYPEPTKDPEPQLNPTQQAALHISQKRTLEANKRVSERVKALYIIGGLGALSAAFGLWLGIGMITESFFGIVVLILSLAQLAMAVYLIAGYDQRLASLFLKAFLLFQIISVFGSLGNPAVWAVSGLLFMVAAYAYFRVNALQY